MQSAIHQFSSFVALTRLRHAKNMRFALLLAVLIALLLWQTQWLSLRPALYLLLIGQLGTAAILFYRTIVLARESELDHAAMLGWFDTEEAFVKYLALFENGVRTVGLLILAYGFWVPTRNTWIALVLGIVYPLTAYFGMVRGNILRTIRNLRTGKREMQELFAS